MTISVGVAILAAGEGKRLNLDVPKPLAPVSGVTLVDFVLDELQIFFEKNKLNGNIGLVVGHKKEMVKDYLEKNYKGLSYAVQEKQLGTGDALKSYFNGCEFASKCDYTLVVCADTPLLKSTDFDLLLGEVNSKKLEGVCASFNAQNPFGYGRIVKDGIGFKIVEQKDTSIEQQKISEVNSGLYLLKTSYVLNQLENINNNNNSGEFYLTDVFKTDANVSAVCFNSDENFLGVNDLIQLEEAQRILSKRKVEDLQRAGVRFINSSSCYIEKNVKIGKGTVVYPNVTILNDVEIGENAVVESGAFLKKSKILSGTQIKAYSYVEEALVREEAAIGPFARLRKGSDIGNKCKIGNFVETKQVRLDQSVSVSHLSYVGDAEIGENTNIGCGFITCNYDGENKSLTKIGKNCFIGSDTQMIAPVNLGDYVYVASGSTINKDIEDYGFGIARCRQETKPNLAKKFLKGKFNKS